MRDKCKRYNPEAFDAMAKGFALWWTDSKYDSSKETCENFVNSK